MPSVDIVARTAGRPKLTARQVLTDQIQGDVWSALIPVQDARRGLTGEPYRLDRERDAAMKMLAVEFRETMANGELSAKDIRQWMVSMWPVIKFVRLRDRLIDEFVFSEAPARLDVAQDALLAGSHRIEQLQGAL